MARISVFPSVRRFSGSIRISLLASTMLAGVSMLDSIQVSAQTTTYVRPLFYYTTAVGLSFFASTSLSADFADAVAAVPTMNDANWTYTASNLHPDATQTTYYDGIIADYRYALQYCSTATGQCTTNNDWGEIITGYTCPVGSLPTDLNSPAKNQLLACPAPTPVLQPKDCPSKSCIGDPIFAATGQMKQPETDYAGATGLNFTRTYRSTTGFFASAVTQSFFDGSAAAGTTSTGCYQAIYNDQYIGKGAYCFPYISVYGYANNGLATYQMLTGDGRSFGFSGPNNSVTAAADINERVTQITFNGANAWQVNREDDSIEIYNSTGPLVQRTVRGGQAFTYVYSTSSTPANIAPYPGLLLTQSDAFGHTLSWQYNSAGQMSQMTDPAGGLYQYGYDVNGNLTGVTYPDSTSKTYWFNESADRGGSAC